LERGYRAPRSADIPVGHLLLQRCPRPDVLMAVLCATSWVPWPILRDELSPALNPTNPSVRGISAKDKWDTQERVPAELTLFARGNRLLPGKP
jgi:hypothetical protein